MHRPRRNGLALIVLVVASVAYPAAVYLGRAAVPPLVFVAAALLLLGLRTVTLNLPGAREQRGLLIAAAVALAGLAALDASVAAKAYPVAMSAAFAAVFGMSLVHPPSVVERFARRRQPDLPPEGQAYCRAVTMAWTAWLSANAVIALLLAIFASDAVWALWTGIVAYLIMGLLFAGELIVRRMVVGPRTAA